MNSPAPFGHGASTYRGVARRPGTKKWRAQIQLHLGSYNSEQEAATIYARAERLFRDQALNLRRTCGDLREQ